MNVWLAGFFAFAAVHYAIQWWFSRSERVLLLFSILCALHSAFSVAYVSLVRATTIPGVQAGLVDMITFGMLGHAVALHIYAYAGGRSDRAFRAIITVGILALVVLNLWVPLRGTVIAIEPIPLPGGGVGMLAVRTPPGAPLVMLYVAALTTYGYGLVAVRTLWRRDRSGALFVAVGVAMHLAAAAIGILVDFAGMKSPYLGSIPITIYVLFMGIFLSREYSARGARIVSTEKMFEAAFDHSPVGKALLGLDGRLLRANRALRDILGATAAEVSACRLSDFIRDDGYRFVEVQSRRLLAGEISAFDLERPLVRKDGNPAWARIAVSVVPDDRGQPVRLMLHLDDVTELRAHRERLEELVATRTIELRVAKEEAEKASQIKSRFLAHMSHEIRNPLHSMVLNAQLIELDADLDAAQRKRVENVQRSGEHLSMLINDVLEMSRVEAGRLELLAAPFELVATLDEVAQMFAPQATSMGTELTIAFDPSLSGSLFADGGKVKQVLINLVSNAVKFTRGGSIRISVKRMPASRQDGATLVEIAVADTGIGIEARDLARIFQPFEQIDAGARVGGTGLGLAISRAHAKLMGGDVQVASTPGVGSTFSFTFVADRVGLKAVPEAPSQPWHFDAEAARYKVLVVDDEPDNCEPLAELLADLGFEARTAADGADALEIHVEWEPDIVLMDLRMPGMNGLEVIRVLRAVGSKAAIGVLTAGAFGDDEHQALSAGADFFIRKPYDGRDLLDIVRRALASRVMPPPADDGVTAVSM